MAIISNSGKFVLPNAYYGCSHGHIPSLALESSTISAQVDNWSRSDIGAQVSTYSPHDNKVVLSNGREYTYKALVLAPVFDV